MIRSILLLAVLATSFIPSSVRAEPNGNWVGEAHFMTTQTKDVTLNCTIGIIRNGKFLYVDDSAGCTYTPDYITRFEIRGDDLFFEDEKVGVITPTGLVFRVSNSSVDWDLSLRVLAGGQLQIIEAFRRIRERYSDITLGKLAVDATRPPRRIRATPGIAKPKRR